GAATRPRRRTPRQPEGHAPRQEAASRRRVVLRVLSRSLIHATPDISTWGKGGHFYFVLTWPGPPATPRHTFPRFPIPTSVSGAQIRGGQALPDPDVPLRSSN